MQNIQTVQQQLFTVLGCNTRHLWLNKIVLAYLFVSFRCDENSGNGDNFDPILDVSNSCTSGHTSCNSLGDFCNSTVDSCNSGVDSCNSGVDSCNSGVDSCNSGDDSFPSHSTPSKMVHDGFVDFNNEISDICSMDMENIVIIVSLWKSFFLVLLLRW